MLARVVKLNNTAELVIIGSAWKLELYTGLTKTIAGCYTTNSAKKQYLTGVASQYRQYIYTIGGKIGGCRGLKLVVYKI